MPTNRRGYPTECSNIACLGWGYPHPGGCDIETADGQNLTDEPVLTAAPPLPWAWRQPGEMLPAHTVEDDGIMYPSGTRTLPVDPYEMWPDLGRTA